MPTPQPDEWSEALRSEAITQIAELINTATGLAIDARSAPNQLRSTKVTRPSGVLAVEGRVDDEDILVLRIDLVQCAPNARFEAAQLFRRLSALDERCRPTQRPVTATRTSFSCTLRIQAKPLSPTRAAALLDQFRGLDEFASALQAEVPRVPDHAALEKLYAPFSEVLEPVRPLGDDPDPELAQWCQRALDLLEAGISLAVEGDDEVRIDIALEALARVAAGRTFARTISPSLTARALVEICRRAPGTIVVSASRLALGGNPYEIGAEMGGALQLLSRHPAIFTGTLSTLHSALGGGQGGRCDPLMPAILPAPRPDTSNAARHVLRGSVAGGPLPAAEETRLAALAVSALAGLQNEVADRVLAPLCRRMGAASHTGTPFDVAPFVSALAGRRDTLGGLPRSSLAARPEHYTARLTGTGFEAELREALVGQDAALSAVARRLRAEALTRPTHQPLRVALLGTAGTGKSETAAILARWLGVALINVDAAGLGDPYTAASQLLGSARGIVGSHAAGRLERAAKEHGAVLEVSDLDHAQPAVRSFLADLFLQALETGVVQTSMGAMIPVAGLVVVFTLNLPGSAAENLGRSAGFGDEPSARDLGRVAAREIQQLTSGAFQSRIGTPIVFPALSPAALGTLIERHVVIALRTAATRLGLPLDELSLAPGLGQSLLATLPGDARSTGVRGVLEHARQLAVEALVDAHPTPSPLVTLQGGRLVLL